MLSVIYDKIAIILVSEHSVWNVRRGALYSLAYKSSSCSVADCQAVSPITGI